MHKDAAGEAIPASVVNEARHFADKVNSDSVPLDQYLRDVGSAVAVEAEKARVAQNPAMRAFSRHMSLDCRACADKARAQICNGSIADGIAIASGGDGTTIPSGGECWTLLAGLIQMLGEFAQLHYAHVPTMQNAVLRVAWKTQIAAHGDIGGATTFPRNDAASNRAAEIMIDLPDEGLDESHFGKLPYVIFHEIFVHAPESWGSAGRRYPSSDMNPFREGFLDRLAYLLLEQFLKKRLSSPFAHATDFFLAQAEVAHSGRLDLGGSASLQTRAAEQQRLRIGARQHGRTLLNRWQDICTLKRIARLSTRLNALELTDKQQRKLLKILDLATEAAEWDEPDLRRGDWLSLVGEMEALVQADDQAILALLDRVLDSGEF